MSCTAAALQPYIFYNYNITLYDLPCTVTFSDPNRKGKIKVKHGTVQYKKIPVIWARPPPGIHTVPTFLSLYSDKTREVILTQNTWGHRADTPKVYLMFRLREHFGFCTRTR